MNRRSFITKALAGLAAVPLVSGLVKAESADVEIAWKGTAESLASVFPAEDHWQLYNQECPFDFSASTRERIVREVREHEMITLCRSEISCGFSKLSHEELDQWCEANTISLYAMTDGTFRAFDVISGLGGAYMIPWPVSSASS